MKIVPAEKSDLARILEIQKAAFLSEAEFYNLYEIRPLKMTLADIENDFVKYTYLKAVDDSNIVTGSIKYSIENSTGHIGNVVVDPVFQNKGIGSALMAEAIKQLAKTERIELFTGHKSFKNIALYEKFNFKIFREATLSENEPKMVFMEKYNGNE
ncbi:MAG: GNAT family N-acetyltransferase [Spirochaetes bacterium]|nr:GNAT family N-acetyltransferase [Spirochaetota bacterium]